MTWIKRFICKHFGHNFEVYPSDKCYLTHTFTPPFIGHTNFSKGYDMSDIKECQFTQSEIDDMETGSYEQIAVTFEEA